MTDIVQEISEDYDHDSEDPFGPLDNETTECKALHTELEQLLDSVTVIEDTGMTPMTFQLLQSAKLLSGTSLDALAMESFDKVTVDSPETEMAVEALLDKVKEKSAAFASRVFDVVKKASATIVQALGRIKDGIINFGANLVSKAWDTTKATGRVIKAHPFKTIMAVLAAAGVVATIVTLASAPAAYKDQSTIKAMMSRIRDLINGIHWPFAKAQAEIITKTTKSFEVYEVAFKTTKTVEYAVESKTLVELSWSQTAVKSVLSQFNKVWSAIKGGLSTMLSPAVNLVKRINNLGGEAPKKVGAAITKKTNSKLTGWIGEQWVTKLYTTALWTVTGVLVKLLHSFVMKAFVMVRDTFHQLDNNKTQPA